jgi:hypothetical protein
MKRVKTPAVKAKTEVPFCPVIGRLSVDELGIYRHLDRMQNDLQLVRQAMHNIVCRHNVIDDKGGALDLNLDTGEIRRRG